MKKTLVFLIVILFYIERKTSCPVTSTSCPTEATCCASEYSGTGYGCCPYPNAVCCANNQTCCRSGSTCVLSGPYLTSCVSAQGIETGISVCKPGPVTPPSTTVPNVLIMGDSVSIGYTPYVSKVLANKYQVSHTPYDVIDGGAEETAYGLQCLNYFLSTALQEPYKADIILFNWGLHNFNNGTVPGQNGPPSVYTPQLEQITQQLAEYVKEKNIKLLWVTTTPVPYDSTLNEVVVSHNVDASDIMTKYGIPQVDLHAQVIKFCGPVPFWDCSISLNREGAPNLHYNDQGYQYLTSFLVTAIEKALGHNAIEN